MNATARQLNGIDHRWGERIPVDLPVRVSVRTSTGIGGRMKNLSLSGALISADVDIRLHALIELTLTLPPPARREMVIKAHVTRKDRQDVGIEWCEYASSDVKELLWSHRFPADVGSVGASGRPAIES